MENYKKTYLLLFLIVLVFGSVGCSKEQPKLQYDNKSDVSAVQKHDLTVEIERLNRPNDFQMSLSIVHDINALKSAGVVKIIRYNKNRYYSITPIKDDKYLLLLYGENDDILYAIDGFLVSTLANRTAFEDISVGMDREEIIKKDPSSCVFDHYSYHRFSDKSILCIKYETNTENQYLVSEYYYLENPVSVLDYLLPKDLEKIQQS